MQKTDFGPRIYAIKDISLAEILVAFNSIRSTAIYSGGMPKVTNVKSVLKSDVDVCANFNVLRKLCITPRHV